MEGLVSGEAIVLPDVYRGFSDLRKVQEAKSYEVLVHQRLGVYSKGTDAHRGHQVLNFLGIP